MTAVTGNLLLIEKNTLITPYLNSQWLNPNHRGLRDDAYYGLIIGSSEIWSDKGAA